MISEELAQFLESGLSMHVAARDASLAPHGARAWGAIVDEDRIHVTTFVHESEARAIVTHLAANGSVALGFERPTDHRACQLKGVFTGSRAGTADDMARVAAQSEAFCRDLEAVGVPRALLAASRPWPCVALRVRVEALFSQTPGPGAGERMA